MTKQGGFIAIEGQDGTGKGTQQKLLIDRLEREGLTVVTVDFPQYESSIFGRMAGEYLNGKYGDQEKIDPRLSSLVFAADRWKASEQIRESLAEGKIVVANRYTLSNMAHQSARMPEESRMEFIDHLRKLEFDHENGFGIPVPDLYFHLDVPIEISMELVLKKSQRSYLGNSDRDQLEADELHQIEAAKMYRLLAEQDQSIITINCDNGEGGIKDIEVIHELIWSETNRFLNAETREGQIKREREG